MRGSWGTGRGGQPMGGEAAATTRGPAGVSDGRRTATTSTTARKRRRPRHARPPTAGLRLPHRITIRSPHPSFAVATPARSSNRPSIAPASSSCRRRSLPHLSDCLSSATARFSGSRTRGID